jgi:cell division protein FtsW (lipid II flippase)
LNVHKMLMLTATEKRFIKYWEDQRTGGRVKYYLLYIVTGTFVAILVLSFLLMMFSGDLGNNVLYIVIGSFVLVTTATIFSWWMNEKKFKAIIQREIRKGIEKDDLEASANGQ